MKSVLYYYERAFNNPHFPMLITQSRVGQTVLKAGSNVNQAKVETTFGTQVDTEEELSTNDLYGSLGLIELSKTCDGTIVYENIDLPEETQQHLRELYKEVNLMPPTIGEDIRPYIPDEVVFHAHNFLEITKVEKGNLLYIADNKIHAVSEGDIIIFNKSFPHAWISIGEETAIVKDYSFLAQDIIFKDELKLQSDYLFYFINTNFKYIHIKTQDPTYNDQCKILLDIDREFEQKSIAFENMIKVRLMEFFTTIARGQVATDQQSINTKAVLNDLLLYIDRNLSEPIHLKDAAKLCFMSPTYFSAFFKQQMGINFSYYVNKLRYEKAFRLLQETDMRILDVALICGFNTLSNFYRVWGTFNTLRPADIRKEKRLLKMVQKKTLVVDMLSDEYWWGGCAHDGPFMPYHQQTAVKRKMDPNTSPNQANPFFVSSKGRYIWCDNGFDYTIEGGQLKLTYTKTRPVLYDGFGTLRSAFQAASKKHFPPSGKSPADITFSHPQYNTWIEFTHEQNQKGVLNYAHSILENGMPTGILMIDCGWAKYHGDLEFDAKKFPDPKGLIATLHDMGFKVMLWVSPFITPDTSEYRELQSNKLLVMDKNHNASIKHWWDGYSAVLDFTNPGAVKWFDKRLKHLMRDYGVDGFKFDGGDAYYYSDDDVTYASASANDQSSAFARYGTAFQFNEYRSCFKLAGEPLAQRLCDKRHSWDEVHGVGALIPSQLAQGILGYAYTCPDMIGGGEYVNFGENAGNLDFELFVRYAQCAALMPAMQFSAAPWRLLDAEHFNICRQMAQLHLRYSDIILQLVHHAKLTGEPIVRYMEYVFPGQGFEKTTDQFMLGDTILVAPVMTKGTFSKTVKLPEGRWRFGSRVYDGGTKICVDIPLDKLAIFHLDDASN